MAIRLNFILVFYLIANLLYSQDYAYWLSNKEFRKYDSIAKELVFAENASISFHEALNKWKNQKNSNSSSYSYIVLSHSGGYTSSTTLTAVYVRNDEIDSSKSVRLVSNGVKYNCVPSLTMCPLKLKIDSLHRTMNSFQQASNIAFRKLVVKHVEDHSVVLLKTISRYEGLDNHYAKLNNIAVLDIMTMDDLFAKILTQLGNDANRTIPVKINEEHGYIEYFNEGAIKEIDSEAQFMQDYSENSYYIVDFQWK